MFPQEHGAYGQLLFPILTALAMGRPGGAAAALAFAAVAAFLAHEPLLVLLGQRGSHRGREQRGAAIGWFSAFSLLAVGFTALALALAPPSARLAVVGPLLLALGLAGFIFSGREHSLAGEAMSAVALSSAAYPIGVMSSASSRASLSCAAAFAAAFVIAVACVHAVIAATRRQHATQARVVGIITAIAVPAVVVWLASVRLLEVITPVAVAPAAIVGLWLALRPPSARRLRVVGWTLVATSAATMAMLLAAFR